MQTDSVVEYKINENDEITFLSDSWDPFARESDAPELVSEKVINCSLWDFITDETTRQLYKDMLKLVRQSNFIEFNFNCDSSNKIRLMEMIISSAENDAVLF
jgi:hypothetical protein